MKSLTQFIEESMCKGKKLGPKDIKRLNDLMKDYNPKKYKRNKELDKYFKKALKEAIEVSDNDILDTFSTWVEDTIDRWVEVYGNDSKSKEILRNDLENAGSYILKSLDYFYEKFNLKDYDLIEKFGEDKLLEIIQHFAEGASQYLDNTYDYWDDADFRFDNDPF